MNKPEDGPMAEPDPNAGAESQAPAAPGIPVRPLLWVFAGGFLVLAGLSLYVYFRVPMADDTPAEAMLIPAALFGLIGLVCLILAASGVGAQSVIPIQPLPGRQAAADEPAQASRGDVDAALARLKANLARAPFAPELPFFHLGYTGQYGPRIFRVFPIDNAFAFVSLYTNSLDPQPPSPTATGGVIGGFNAYAHALGQEELQERIKVLERMRDVQLLRDFIDKDPESFLLETAGTRDIRIDPATMWDKAKQAGSMVAKVVLVHPSRGKMAFHVPAFQDLTKVVEEFPRRFGDAVRIAPWNAFA
jgi:hypothetical protein